MMRLLLSSPRLGVVLLLVGLAACGGGGNKNQAYIEKPVDDLYNGAMDQLINEDYGKAASTFGEVESQHPYSVWATKSQLMAIYAYYVKAICYYIQITDVGRDQKITELAVKALDDVVRRFPDSKYARDAKLKLDFTHDHLAGKEMEIGRFYLKQGEYLAAMNRFRRVIDNYQTTTHVPEALERLVECDLALGLTKEAQANAAVLGYNYPGSHWYENAYALVAGNNAPGQPSKGWFGSLF